MLLFNKEQVYSASHQLKYENTSSNKFCSQLFSFLDLFAVLLHKEHHFCVNISFCYFSYYGAMKKTLKLNRFLANV